MAPHYHFDIYTGIYTWKEQTPETKVPDQIKKELVAHTSAYALRSFQNFKKFHGQIRFFPTSNSRPLFESGEPVGFNSYYIEATGHCLREVDVRIDNMKVELSHNNEWTDLPTILENIPAPTTWEKPGEPLSVAAKLALWDKQWQWYYHNTKTFPFLRLPSEIRELIYSFLFPSTFQTYPYCMSQRRPWKVSAGISQQQGNANILRANKQLHNEASHILFRDTTFLIENTSIMNRALRHTPALAKNMTRLELSFNHTQYLRLFGFYLNEHADYPPKDAAYALRNLDLKLLTLRIAEPETYNSRSPSGGRKTVTSCQKKAVKYILRTAYPFVKGHPVEIEGFVARKQKERFEGAMRGKRDEFERWREIGDGAEGLREWDEDEGGVELEDGEGAGAGEGEEGEDVVEKTREWPPRCRCKVHCGEIRDWGM
ncbi:hypothetical protein CLAFUW4_02173 [Fulvia fulva]|uniref:Uncharacterized protein n=1 Tax=Passalora fulva TaxID=5499 RepID=A0A9Q8L6X7_PASFU|nr:uncharacterized protein CLAFUR5_02165 [Fulvia fulva]UJO11922.1 hypothetical protein CLAFUR5_02165 [Fulvia fulva]WPV08893.1 hypothetical protein CLAFUW4_02173 [Fulvia fulva]